MTRLKDIAAAAEVSVRTVGRALTGQGYIDADVRERVLDAAKRLDYQPHRLARSLRTGRSHEVLALAGGVGGAGDELHIAKIQGLERTLRAAGYSFGLLFGLESEARRTGRDMLEELIERRPAGVALFADHQLPVEAAARRLHHAGVPYVFLDPREEAVDGVRHDRAQGVEEAIAWLAARGRQRIAYVGPTDERSRLVGYERAMHALGRPPIIVPMPVATWADGRAAAARLLALDPHPDAAQVYSDVVALGFLAGLHEAGARIPGDVAVIGFDDRAAAALAYPPLTTVQQANVELGSAAAAILLAKIEGRLTPATGWSRRIPTRLIVRAST